MIAQGQFREEGQIARSLRQVAMAILILGLPCVAEASSRCQRSLRELPIDQLSVSCAEASRGSCTVADSGIVSGSAHFGELRYQLIHFDDADLSEAVIFKAGSSGHMLPFICNQVNAGYYEHGDRPQVFSLPHGHFLALPPIEQGTGGPQGALLYQWRRGRWRTVDLASWQKGFARRLAPKYVGWRGVGYDFKHMTGESFLYAPGDAHARPSGYAKMRFAVVQGVLTLSELNVGSSEPVFDAMCRANPKCKKG